jgi:hypothetical protein
MGSHCPFEHLNTNYGQKKGQESNWQFDSRPLKVGNRPDLLVFRWRARYHWKTLNRGYNFALDLIAIKGLHMKLCALKVARIPVVGILGLPLRSPGTKSHLDVALVESCRVYYKGEGGGFPQVQALVSLVNPNCLWFVLTPKVLQLCINPFVLVLCKFVWVIEACHFFLVPSQNSSKPLYPSIVLRTKEPAPTPCPSVVLNLGFTFESFKELGARHYWFYSWMLKFLTFGFRCWKFFLLFLDIKDNYFCFWMLKVIALTLKCWKFLLFDVHQNYVYKVIFSKVPKIVIQFTWLLTQCLIILQMYKL